MNRVIELLNAEANAHGLAPLCSDSIAALSDREQWEPMLDDLRDRCGMDVSEAAQLLMSGELIATYNKEAHDDVEPEALHALMCAGSVSDYFDSNTGGGVWVSWAVFSVCCDTVRLLAVTTCDGCTIYNCGVDGLNVAYAEHASRLFWELGGDEQAHELAAI